MFRPTSYNLPGAPTRPTDFRHRTAPPLRKEERPVNPLKAEFDSLAAVQVGDHKEILGVRLSETPREGWVKCGWVSVHLGTLGKALGSWWVDPGSLGSIYHNAMRRMGPDGARLVKTTAWGFSVPKHDRRPEPCVEVVFADHNDYEAAVAAQRATWLKEMPVR